MVGILRVSFLTVENVIEYFKMIINYQREKNHVMRPLQKIRLENLKIIYLTTDLEQHGQHNSLVFIT